MEYGVDTPYTRTVPNLLAPWPESTYALHAATAAASAAELFPMKITIVTIFPEFFDSALGCGLLAKARGAGVVQVEFVNPREFATDRHRSVDDRPYGGGPGMVMTPGPLSSALESIPRPGRMLSLAPDGAVFTQAIARELSQEPALTLLCGRYEGYDARLEQLFPLEPVSVGDFVLNGGETAALCVIEAVSRLLPDFMGCAGSGEEESFSSGLLEYPHYSRPEMFRGLEVPEVLRSGDHARIAAWRQEQSLRLTLKRRPEMLSEAALQHEEISLLQQFNDESDRLLLGSRLYLALVHHPVLDKSGKIFTTSLTNLDVHDIARVSRCYNVGGYCVVTPLDDQRKLAAELIAHWASGPGGEGNPDRAEALRTVWTEADLDGAVQTVSDMAGEEPLVLATSAQPAKKAAKAYTPGRVRTALQNQPVLLLFGTGHGLAPSVLERAHGCMRGLRFLDAYNHFSVRSAVAVTVDRILGDAW